MGRVYRAVERESGDERAIKALRPGAPASELYSLKREFRTGGPLAHPNLIPIFDLVVDGGTGYLVMPLLRGRTLDRWAREVAWQSTPDRLLGVFAAAARGLTALHRAGVVHRDIKPSNIMVEPDDHVYVLDYGLATPEANATPFVTSSPAQLAGTAAYMPPEAMLGASPKDTRDVFALGVTLFEAVRGELPARDLHDWSVDVAAVRDAWCDSWPGDAEVLEWLLRMLHEDPEARPGMMELARALGHTPSDAPPAAGEAVELVGRDGERALLAERLTLAGDVTWVSGPSGSGKTTLCVDAIAKLRGAGHVELVLRGRCHPGEHLRFRALDAIVDELTNWVARCGADTRKRLLPRELPVLQEAFGAMRRLDGDSSRAFQAARAPEERRRQLVEGLTSLLRRCHALWPTLLWIDDIQWSDPDGARVLHDVLVRLGGDGPTVLLSGHHLPKALPVHCFEVPLDPLDADGAHALVRARLQASGQEAGDDTVASLIAEARGNPGLLAFMTAHLSAHDDAPTLEALLRRRLDAMETGAVETLQLLALSREPLPQPALAQCVAGDSRHILHGLEAVGLARRVPLGAETGVEVPHAHLSAVVRQAIATEARPALHRRLAACLEPEESVPRAVVAEHWEHAGHPRNAARLLRSAGHESLRHLAFEHAANCFERAIVLDPEAPDADTRTALAEAYALGGRSEDAARTFQDAADESPASDALRLRASQQWILAGDVDRGVHIARGLFAAKGHTIPGEARLLASLAWDRLTRRFRRLAYRLSAGETSPQIAVADTAFAICTTLVLADPVLASYLQRVHLAASLRTGDPLRIARALALESGFRGFTDGGTDGGRALAEEARSVMGERVDPRLDALLAISEAGSAWAAGRWSECVGAATVAERIARESCVGAWWERSFARSTLQDGLRWMGRYDELAALSALFMQDAEHRENRFAAFTYRTRFVTVVELVANRPEAAWQACAGGPGWGSRGTHLQHLAAMHAQAETLLYAGQAERALALVQSRYRAIRWSPLLRAPGPRAKAKHLLASCHLAVAATGRHPRYHRWRARRAVRGLDRAWPYTRLLGQIVRHSGDFMAGVAGAEEALLRCAEQADAQSMPQFRAAIVLAVAQRQGDAEQARGAERALRHLGVRAPRRWASTLVPGLQAPLPVIELPAE